MRARRAGNALSDSKITWPEGKQFAFTVFDDTDLATLNNVGGVYAFLSDCGFRTTKSCWPVAGDPDKGKGWGETCDDRDYLRWMLDLQAKGFEIAWHNSTWHGLHRKEILSAMERYAEIFQQYPASAANHSEGEGIYWGDSRLTGIRARLYNLMTRNRNRDRFRGHVEGDEHFWGDLCKAHITYYRNFVFRDINTLKCCRFMPYHDPQRPYVRYWFASSDGHNLQTFNRCLSERSQDRLEREGGACIMYAHFARGFAQDQGRLEPRFKQLATRLSKKNGWFVPVKTLLDHLQKINGHHQITDAQRQYLEWKWLREKLRVGTS